MTDPLSAYVETLERVEAADFEVSLPEHDEPITEPATRARAILDNHVERARRILAFLSGCGPADTWTVSEHIFGDLEGVYNMHGPGEVHAHL